MIFSVTNRKEHLLVDTLNELANTYNNFRVISILYDGYNFVAFYEIGGDKNGA